MGKQDNFIERGIGTMKKGLILFLAFSVGAALSMSVVMMFIGHLVKLDAKVETNDGIKTYYYGTRGVKNGKIPSDMYWVIDEQEQYY